MKKTTSSLLIAGVFFFGGVPAELAQAGGSQLCRQILTSAQPGRVKMENKPRFSTSVRRIERLLVIAAMEVEIKSILDHLDGPTEVAIHETLALKATTAVIGNREIFVVQSGVGLVSAAVTAAFAIDALKPNAILLLGVAGSVDKSLEIGDIVVAQRVVQHDAVFSGEMGDELMAPGELHLSVSPNLRVPPPIHTETGYSNWIFDNLHKANSRIRLGTVLSGSEFVGRADRKMEIAKHDSNALAVEMEAAGVGQIARKFGLPLIVVKTIADRLNPDGSISSDYLRFSKAAADTAASVIDAILNEWKSLDAGD